MKVALKIIIPIAIVVFAILGFKFLGTLKPKPKSKQPSPIVPVVEVIEVSPADHTPPVRSYGTVASLFETQLTPQVSGKIMWVAPEFRVGEKVDEGHVLVKIDPTDYQAALAREESNLTVAKRSFAEEEIRAQQAAGDWTASGRELSVASDFVLRKPQLAAAQASIESAVAAIAKARADLERTEVHAPFAAMITGRQASPGNQASPQASLGILVSTDTAEIRLPLTAEQSARVEIPSAAVLTSPLKPGASWEAKLVRMEPTVDTRNQVMFAVAQIDQPFAEGHPELPIGMFANVSIRALPIRGSYRIPEAAFVADSFFWVMTSDGELGRVEASRLQGFESDVFVRALSPTPGPLKVVTRPLSNFRSEMRVREEEPEKTTEP